MGHCRGAVYCRCRGTVYGVHHRSICGSFEKIESNVNIVLKVRKCVETQITDVRKYRCANFSAFLIF